MNTIYEFLSSCCDAPILTEIDYDSIDGEYGEQVVVAFGVCPQCDKHEVAILTKVDQKEWQRKLTSIYCKQNREYWSLSELRAFFDRQRCPYCQSEEHEASLTMHMYPHSDGLLLEDGERYWAYGLCQRCSYQWAWQKLMEQNA